MTKVFKTKALPKESIDPTDPPTMFYRYEDVLLNWDYFLNKAKVEIYLNDYEMLRETACGYWINTSGYGKSYERWVRKTSRKRFAYPTKYEALINFKHRKQRQIKLLEVNLSRAKAALDLCIKESDFQIKEYNEKKNKTQGRVK